MLLPPCLEEFFECEEALAEPAASCLKFFFPNWRIEYKLRLAKQHDKSFARFLEPLHLIEDPRVFLEPRAPR